MRTVLIAAVAAYFAAPALAQSPPIGSYVARPGETINLGPVYYVSPATCQNLAVAKPEIEILSGPPGLTTEVREAMVVPSNIGNCKTEVRGGFIWLTVPADIEANSAHVIARITHHDRNGPQPRGYAFNLMIAR